jgi:hypothetical protein
MTETRVSTCLDCSTIVIGERLRCPACHEMHAANLIDDQTMPRQRVVVDLEDDATTAPRQRTGSIFARWIVGLEVLAVIALGIVFVLEECVKP